MSQRLSGANFSLDRKCAPQTCPNNTTIQPTKTIELNGKTAVLGTQPVISTGPVIGHREGDKTKETLNKTNRATGKCKTVWGTPCNADSNIVIFK